MAYSGGYIDNLYCNGNITVNCPQIFGFALLEEASETSVGHLNWFLIIIVGLVAAAVPFLIRLLRHKFDKYDDIYSEIEKGYKDGMPKGELLKRIDVLYTDKIKIKDQFENGGIFERKVWLMNELNDSNKVRNCIVAFLSAILGALLPALVEGNFVGIEFIKSDSISQNTAICALTALIALTSSLLFNEFMFDFEDESGQIRKYELEMINKLIDKRLENRLSAGTVIEKRREIKRNNNYREIKNITTETTKYPT